MPSALTPDIACWQADQCLSALTKLVAPPAQLSHKFGKTVNPFGVMQCCCCLRQYCSQVQASQAAGCYWGTAASLQDSYFVSI